MKRVIITLVKELLPESARDTLRSLRRRARSKWRMVKRARAQRRSLEDLNSDLRLAGIHPGDAIMVHSSLSRIGNVDGGAETVIQSLINTVTSSGTIMMPCYGSAEDVEQGMKEGRFIDLRTSKPVTGVITEVFRTWPDVVRSSHPFSSVCAWGALADYLAAKHATNPYICHADSPVGRMVELDMTLIGLGVPISVGMSPGHYLEDTDDTFPFAVHAPRFPVTYIDSAGNTLNREVIRYDPIRSATRIDHAGGAWILEMFTKHLTKQGIIRWFSVGDAKTWLMNASPLCDELKRLADKGITMYLTKDEWQTMNGGEEIIESW